MHGKLARAILPLVTLALIAALAMGASGTCCIGNLCLFGGGDDGGDDGGITGRQVSWSTDVASLQCADFYIVANGQTFYGDVDQVEVHSDPGWPGYCTLEMIWQENGVEMRLFIYFKADGSKWWADEIRTYDGQANADWIYYTGTFFESPLGEPYSGSYDIANESMTSMIHFGGLNLQAFLSDTSDTGIHPVTGLALNKWETTMATGSTEQLVAAVEPATATDPSVAWSSSDSTIASVDASGLVSAVDNGTATITVTTVDQGLTASCSVTVVDWLELSIRDASDNQSLVFGQGDEVRFVITMRNPTDEALGFTCLDTQVYDIQVYSSDNVLVWNWAHEVGFLQVVTGFGLEPGDERTYEETWDQTDNQGLPVAPGTYTVYLEMVCGGLQAPGPYLSGPQQIEMT